MGFEFFVAMRYLRSRRKERFVSVITTFSFLGIALGVATLIIVMSVMNGFRAELVGRIIGVNGHIVVSARSQPIDDYEALSAAIRQVPGAIYAGPLLEGQAMATSSGRAQGALVRGMRGGDLAERRIIADNLVSGSIERFEPGTVVLGYRLADRLGVILGDRLTLIAPTGSVSPFGTIPRQKAVTVAGIFDVGMSEYDGLLVFMPLGDAQTFFQTGDRSGSIEILTDNPADLGQVLLRVASLAGEGRNVVDWRRTNAGFVGALEVERNVMFLILTLIILVAAFNIVSSLVMLVQDKGREIAILRAMGASRGSVMRLFVIAGGVIGISGTLAGFGLGLAFSLNIETIRQMLQSLTGSELFPAEIYFLSQLPAKVDNFEVGLVVCMGLVLSILATIYPAWRAGRLHPADALRYE